MLQNKYNEHGSHYHRHHYRPKLVPENRSAVRATYDPFAGSNQKGQFENFGQFYSMVVNEYDSNFSNITDMSGWVFQEVDLSSMTKEQFVSLPLKGSAFLSCIFPDGVYEEEVRRIGATHVLFNPKSLPFKPLRPVLYNQQELATVDATIYEFWKSSSHDVSAHLSFALHDFSIMDALIDFCVGKSFVAVMGGHAVKRVDSEYALLVKLAYRIANVGFFCVTGGGPGAMEAVNLGAYLTQICDNDDMISSEQVAGDDTLTDQRLSRPSNSSENTVGTEECNLFETTVIDKALNIIRTTTEGFEGPEMLDVAAAERVIEIMGSPQSHTPSLGIPTWYYGHEPSNKFAAYQAKFFQNSIREDLLLDICYGGLIITRGGPGTFQEVFQACCKNAYAPAGKEYPMIFFGKKFWTDCGIWDVVQTQAQGRAYSSMLLLSDDIDEIVDHLYTCATKKNLPLLVDCVVSDMMNPYWFSKPKTLLKSNSSIKEEDESSQIDSSNK